MNTPLLDSLYKFAVGPEIVYRAPSDLGARRSVASFIPGSALKKLFESKGFPLNEVDAIRGTQWRNGIINLPSEVNSTNRSILNLFGMASNADDLRMMKRHELTHYLWNKKYRMIPTTLRIPFEEWAAYSKEMRTPPKNILGKLLRSFARTEGVAGSTWNYYLGKINPLLSKLRLR